MIEECMRKDFFYEKQKTNNNGELNILNWKKMDTNNLFTWFRFFIDDSVFLHYISSTKNAKGA